MEISIIVFTAVAVAAVFCTGFGAGVAAGCVMAAKPVKSLAFTDPQSVERAETDSERLARLLAENVENYGTDRPLQDVV